MEYLPNPQNNGHIDSYVRKIIAEPYLKNQRDYADHLSEIGSIELAEFVEVQSELFAEDAISNDRFLKAKKRNRKLLEDFPQYFEWRNLISSLKLKNHEEQFKSVLEICNLPTETADESQVREAEKSLGIIFPRFYSWFVTRVADGFSYSRGGWEFRFFSVKEIVDLNSKPRIAGEFPVSWEQIVEADYELPEGMMEIENHQSIDGLLQFASWKEGFYESPGCFYLPINSSFPSLAIHVNCLVGCVLLWPHDSNALIPTSEEVLVSLIHFFQVHFYEESIQHSDE